MRRRVVVTGLGVVAPNGLGNDEFAKAIFNGCSGVDSITRFDTSKYSVKIAAEVKNFDPVDYMPVSVMRKTDRFAQLGIAATKLAIEDAGISDKRDVLSRAGIIVGSGLGGQNFHEETIIAVVRNNEPRKAAASAVPRIMPNAVSGHIAILYNIKGPNLVISTACSSSAQAIGESYEKIKNGSLDIVITGGVEAPITEVTIAAYQSMMVLTTRNGSPSEASRPFDATRDGFVIGEGAAILLLEEFEHAESRGATIYAEVIGFGSNCGAYHMVSPNPKGEDAALAMESAMEDGRIRPEQVDYINAHGTSTKWNDLAETNAIKLTFGSYAKKVPVSSIKSMIGHTIGAAGAIEAAASCLSLRNGIIPPTINLLHPDPECDLDYVPNKARSQPLTIVMSNSFGFGSNNAVLLFRKM